MAKAIEMLDITKVFPGVIANDRICFEVEEGEIHALLGENGAGKSTLMSILFGLYEADAGVIRIRRQVARIRSPNDATALRIGMVHQHFKLVHNFTVTENIVLGLEPRDKWGGLDLKSAHRRVALLSERYGLAVDPRARIENISVGMQQRVEILKILYRDADILIFDEPSAVLTPQEIDELLAIFRRIKGEGKTIIFITHKLREIKAIADRCTILRRGKYIATVNVSDTANVPYTTNVSDTANASDTAKVADTANAPDTTNVSNASDTAKVSGATISEDALAELMVGRAVSFRIDKQPAIPRDVVLRIENLTVMGARGVPAVRDFSLDVLAGEVMGIAGVDGNGQAELVAAIAGLEPVKSGRILLNGKNISHESIRKRIREGIGFVPEDRHKYGLVLDFRVDENLILKTFREKRFSNHFGFLQFPSIHKHAADRIAEFDIRAGNGGATIARSMSGGNQQKVIIAREIDLSPRLLVVAQPTRGLDVGAIEYIHQRIIAERDKGRAVLLVSFELDELLSLSDRIAALSKGALVGVVNAALTDERRIGAMMGGYAGRSV